MFFYEQIRNDPSGCIYHQRNVSLSFAPHLHNSFELIYVYEGRLDVIVDTSVFSVSEGQAILIFPNQIHATKYSEGAETYLCIFQNSLVGEFYQNSKNTVAEFPVFKVNGPELINKISRSGDCRYLLKAYLYEIIHQFNSTCGKYVQRSNNITKPLEKIIAIISDRYPENINMKIIADELGYDHRYLSSLLKKHLNTTFRAFLNEYRVAHAKHLLISRTDIIANIAYECGYESVVSFNRNFKSITGITPSDFRAKYSKN